MDEDDDTHIRITLRLPKSVHESLTVSAARTSKSLNAEIVSRLQSATELEKRIEGLITETLGYKSDLHLIRGLLNRATQKAEVVEGEYHLFRANADRQINKLRELLDEVRSHGTSAEMIRVLTDALKTKDEAIASLKAMTRFLGMYLTNVAGRVPKSDNSSTNGLMEHLIRFGQALEAGDFQSSVAPIADIVRMGVESGQLDPSQLEKLPHAKDPDV